MRTTIANFEELANAGTNNTTKNHGHWADMTLSFTDIKHTMQAVTL